MHKTNLRRILIAATAAGTVAVLPSTPALARDVVACGTVLTASVTLSADLVCIGDGLVIGAHGITVDMAGHSITGDGTGTAVKDHDFNDLAITGGTIAGFATGIDLFQALNVNLTDLTIRDGQAAKTVLADNARFTNVDFRDTTVTLEHSTPTDFTRITANNTQFQVREDANQTSFTKSHFFDSSIDGFEADLVHIADNMFVRSPIGYRVTSRDWLIEDNSIVGADAGVTVGGASPRGRIINNKFLDNRVGVRVKVGFIDEADGTVIADNFFIHNDAAGLLIDSGNVVNTPTVTIKHNKFTLNGFSPAGLTDHNGAPVADGAHIAAAAGSQYVVADNLTIHNAQYGIFAVPGTVVDGGGNVSVTDPLGCSGVVCA